MLRNVLIFDMLNFNLKKSTIQTASCSSEGKKIKVIKVIFYFMSIVLTL